MIYRVWIRCRSARSEKGVPVSGEPVVIVTDGGNDDAQFAAGVAAATAEQAAETAERAELTAELALDVAQNAAATAAEVAAEEMEDDMSQAEFDAFKAETQGTLAAILDRLDQRDVTADSEEETAGPPAPAPKVDEGQDDGPVATPEQDNDDEGTPAEKPKPPKDDNGPSYGARSWFGTR